MYTWTLASTHIYRSYVVAWGRVTNSVKCQCFFSFYIDRSITAGYMHALTHTGTRLGQMESQMCACYLLVKTRGGVWNKTRLRHLRFVWFNVTLCHAKRLVTSQSLNYASVWFNIFTIVVNFYTFTPPIMIFFLKHCHKCGHQIAYT